MVKFIISDTRRLVYYRPDSKNLPSFRTIEQVTERQDGWPSAYTLAGVVELSLDAGSSFELPVPAGQRVFAYLLAGDALLGIEDRAITAGDLAWPEIPPADRPSTLKVVAQNALRLLVYASPVIDEPIAMDGPFVMNTEQEIQQAFTDLHAGRLIQPLPVP